MNELTVRIRITLLSPPAGVRFALQTRKRELEQVVESTGRDLTFHCTVRMGEADFKGVHVNGPKGARFLYINSGEMAGQKGTCWSRRAKLQLTPLGAMLADRVVRGAGQAPGGRETKGRPEARTTQPEVEVSAHVQGTAGDGGPVCASVPVQWGIEAS